MQNIKVFVLEKQLFFRINGTLIIMDIIIVDDHAVVREGLRLLLGAERDIKIVGEASDGSEVIEMVNKLCPTIPDIIIMDIVMPRLNGIETTRLLKRKYPLIKVIVFSAYDSSEYISQTLRAGANGLLSKESSSAELILALREVFAGKRYLSKKIADKIIETHISVPEGYADVSPVSRLSFREKEILRLVVKEDTNAEIAKKLSISQKTVETYRSRMMKKLGVKGIPGLIKFAIEHSLVSIGTLVSLFQL